MILFFFSLFFRWWIKLVKATLWYNSVSRIYHSVLNLWLYFYFIFLGEGGGSFFLWTFDMWPPLRWLLWFLPWTGMAPFQTGDDGQMILEPLDPPLRAERHPESFCTSAVNYCASCQSVSLSILKVHPWIIMCLSISLCCHYLFYEQWWYCSK